MSGFIIEVEGYEKSDDPPPERLTTDQSSLIQKLKRSYDDFFENNYEAKLHKDKNNEAIYPQFTLIRDDEADEIIFDYNLLEQLFDSYFLDGWNGISEIEIRIAEITKDDSKENAGGVKDKKWQIDVHPKEDHSWNLAKNFFAFAQKIFALIIRETLANIERFSAEQIIAKLSVTNIELAKAFDRYTIKEKLIPHEGPESPNAHYYTLEKKSEAQDLFSALTKAVNEKFLYDLYVVKVNFLPTAILDAEASSKKYAVENPPFSAIQKERAEEMKKELAKYSSLKDASEKLLKILKDELIKKHPLGLLVYGSLPKKFTQPEMEDIFGLLIDRLRKDIESLGTEIDPQISQVKNLLPFRETGNSSFDVYSFTIPAGGLERFVLETCLANFEESKFLPLISEEIFNQLADKEIIKPDSFENVVGFHYRSALILKLYEIEKEEKKYEDFWKLIGKISSLLSLAAVATLVTPAAEAAPLLRGGAALADLALLAHTVNSVTGAMKKFDEQMRQTLVNPNDLTTDVFAALGDVISLRKSFYNNFTEQIAIEIFNIIAGGNLPVFKEFLLARSYYYDIETLFETNDEDEGEINE